LIEPPFSGGIFDFDSRKEELEEINLELEDPKVWDDPEKAQKLGKRKVALEKSVLVLEQLDIDLHDNSDLLDMAIEEKDQDSVDEVITELEKLDKITDELEFRRMFSGDMDENNAFIDIQSGSGGTEAQDWASMILRMYLRWGEAQGFKTELIEVSDGEVAGIKSATIQFSGEYAYGWLRTETGVHRLVENLLLILEVVAIPHLLPFLPIQRLMMILILMLTQQIYVLILIVQVVLVDSILIKLIRRLE